MECKFCSDYFEIQEYNNKVYRKDFKFKYSIRLVEETIRDGAVRATMTFRKRELKYCPSCGKKLK